MYGFAEELKKIRNDQADSYDSSFILVYVGQFLYCLYFVAKIRRDVTKKS